MAKFNYKMCFSPYGNSLIARNYKEAWEVLKQTYPEYKNIKKVVQYLSRQWAYFVYTMLLCVLMEYNGRVYET